MKQQLILLLALAIAVPVLWVLYYLVGPAVDNKLSIKTARDLELLRNYPVAGVALQHLVAEKYRIKSWGAYHEDWIFATRIDCHALDLAGRSLLLSWEVRHGTPPRNWMPARRLYITPLTRSAAEIAPALLPHGVKPADLPLSKYGSGVVYDIAWEEQSTR